MRKKHLKDTKIPLKTLEKKTKKKLKIVGQHAPICLYRSQVIAFKKWIYSVIGPIE